VVSARVSTHGVEPSLVEEQLGRVVHGGSKRVHGADRRLERCWRGQHAEKAVRVAECAQIEDDLAEATPRVRLDAIDREGQSGRITATANQWEVFVEVAAATGAVASLAAELGGRLRDRKVRRDLLRIQGMYRLRLDGRPLDLECVAILAKLDRANEQAVRKQGAHVPRIRRHLTLDIVKNAKH
jgi:hypothetical protein